LKNFKGDKIDYKNGDSIFLAKEPENFGMFQERKPLFGLIEIFVSQQSGQRSKLFNEMLRPD
jgi:hypothetical protein